MRFVKRNLTTMYETAITYPAPSTIIIKNNLQLFKFKEFTRLHGNNSTGSIFRQITRSISKKSKVTESKFANYFAPRNKSQLGDIKYPLSFNANNLDLFAKIISMIDTIAFCNKYYGGNFVARDQLIIQLLDNLFIVQKETGIYGLIPYTAFCKLNYKLIYWTNHLGLHETDVNNSLYSRMFTHKPKTLSADLISDVDI